MEEEKKCSNCREKVDEYWWENIAKGFCSKECTNEYLEQEGFKPIEFQDESTTIKQSHQ